LKRRWLIALIIALMAAPAVWPANTPQPGKPDQLEQMARAKFGALSRAETILVRSAPERDIHWAGPSDDPGDRSNDPTHSESWGPERTIRASLLEWLVSDPAATRLVHPSGPGIIAARISGPLDLSFQNIPFPLTLVRCVIKDGIDISNTRIRGLNLRASATGPVVGDMAAIAGDVVMTFGNYGQVLFFRAAIDGSLDFSAASVESGEPPAVSGVETTIGGDAIFHQGFATNGTVDFRLARVGQSLSFNHARFFGTQDNGLNAERAVINGPLYWVDVKMTPRTQLDLEDAHAGTLWDDESSWPAPGNLLINGFEYGSFGGDSPADASSRLQWLARRPKGYNPQPYAELAKALTAAGASQDAVAVEIAQRVDQRHEGGLGRFERGWNALLQATIGYGFKPLRALWWIIAFVALGTVLFGWGYSMRAISPTQETAYESFMKSGNTPPHYPRFNAFVYSLENFLPVVDLHQGEYWRPNPSHTQEGIADSERERGGYAGVALRWYLWLHILAGWVLTPLLAAGLSGLIHVG
jgi:hypothetical protein